MQRGTHTGNQHTSGPSSRLALRFPRAPGLRPQSTIPSAFHHILHRHLWQPGGPGPGGSRERWDIRSLCAGFPSLDFITGLPNSGGPLAPWRSILPAPGAPPPARDGARGRPPGPSGPFTGPTQEHPGLGPPAGPAGPGGPAVPARLPGGGPWSRRPTAPVKPTRCPSDRAPSRPSPGRSASRSGSLQGCASA